MRRISVKEARQQLRALLKQVQAGEEVAVLRRGVEVARLLPPRRRRARLPDLAGLRASVRISGRPMSTEVIAGRRSARY